MEPFSPDGLLANYKSQWQFRYNQGVFEPTRAYSKESEGNRFWFLVLVIRNGETRIQHSRWRVVMRAGSVSVIRAPNGEGFHRDPKLPPAGISTPLMRLS